MPPRIRLRSIGSVSPGVTSRATPYVCRQCRHASLAAATTPAARIERGASSSLPPIEKHSRTQPPSHKPPEFRKSQLHRQYQSLLRSSPLTLIFQHNNLKATEWMGIRRELAKALRKVDEDLAKSGNAANIGSSTKLEVVQTGIFASALRVVEFWEPKFESNAATVRTDDPRKTSSKPVEDVNGDKNGPVFTHGLSEQAWATARKNRKLKHGLEPLLSGPLALLNLPTVSPQHLKAAISILAPSKEIPPPRRRDNPGYYESSVQNGLPKLMLLAARVDSQVFDVEGTKWLAGITGGIDGLRGQLVAMLSGVAGGITSTLEAASRSLYLTVEGRRRMLEEEEKGKEGGS